MKYPADWKLTAILSDIYDNDETARGIIDDKLIELLSELGYTIDDNSEYITDEIDG